MSAETCNLTASGLIAALRPVKSEPWQEIFVNDEKVGTIGETDRANPGMRWHWQAMGAFDYAATREQAIAQIEKQAKRHIAQRAAEARAEHARWAEIEALPRTLQVIRISLDYAKDRLEIARIRSIRRPQEIAHWERRVAELETDFAARERTMAEAA